MKSLLILIVAVGAASAESKAEADARARMAVMQKALDDAKRERDVLASALAKLGAATTTGTAKTSQALKAVAQDQLLFATDAAIAAEATARKLADAQAVTALASRDKAVIDERAATDAKIAAAAQHSQNAALFIVQVFALVAILLGIAERLWKSRKDTQKDERDHQWKLEAEGREKAMAATITQVHSLVNSNYTAALENELDARSANLALLRANLVLIQASDQKLSGEVSAITATIASTSIKISELTRTLAERARQTADAAKQLEVDMRRPVVG